VRENLEFFGGIYAAAHLGWAASVCRVGDLQDTLCSALPMGLRQRVALASALSHRPRVVFLDEPTAGVDPAARRTFWDLIYTLAAEGMTVFVSTHYMDEAERCDRIAMIDAGKIVASGSPAELRAGFFRNRLVELACESMFLWFDDLEKMDGVSDVAMYGNKLHLTVADAAAAERAIRELGRQKGLAVLAVREIEPSLEDVFVSVMTERR
jgi:ABC-2 type transport system ATP-binding protein